MVITSPACNYFSLDAALQRLPRQRGADSRRISVHVDPDFSSLHPELGGTSEEERAEWERQYAEAHTRWEAHKAQIAAAQSAAKQ